MTSFESNWNVDKARLPIARDPESLAAKWEQWEESAEYLQDETSAEFALAVRDDGTVRPLLDSIFGNSPFLSHCLISDIAFARQLLLSGPDTVEAELLSTTRDRSNQLVETRTALMSRLRKAKRSIALTAALADIAGVWSLTRTTNCLSEFADAVLDACCSHLLRAAHKKGSLQISFPDDPCMSSGLIILGMGKLGAGELNYSSDIDLIILYDEEVAQVEFGAHRQLFSRMARDLVSIMSKFTADGYVFRTDLRLRPDPSSTPPAVSTTAARSYYRTVGQTWERAAMIKARPVAGDMEAGREFLDSNLGFVWRRNLDFASMRDIQAVKRQINAHRGSASIEIKGHNVKLGRGGIREVEFFTQAQQLVWGGKDIRLRGRETQPMLEALADQGHITRSDARQLRKAYEFLRTVEHRLQMVDDQQTQTLPGDLDGIGKIASFLGYADANDFEAELRNHLEIVERHYDGLLEHRPAAASDLHIDFECKQSAPESLQRLEAIGFPDPEFVFTTFRRWLRGESRATGSKRAREIILEISPLMLESFASAPEPGVALERFDHFLTHLTQSVNLLAILAARPDLLRLIVEIMGAAPRLSYWLSREPELLDSVLQRDFEDLALPDDLGLEPAMLESARRGLVRLFYQMEFGVEEMTRDLQAELDNRLGGAHDFQTVLDVHRKWARGRKFQVGVHMLRGYLSPSEASIPLSGIAQACLNGLLPIISAEFANMHGRVNGGQLAILGFGRLGSREMTMSSDLDMIFVYSHPEDEIESDGAKKLATTQYYAKLCRRFINAITAPTAEGRLYEVDMRLRPSGKSGPIACSFQAFEDYQRNAAWTWEKQSLTRARVVYAEGDLKDRLENVMRSVLVEERHPEQLADEINSMRAKIHAEHSRPGTKEIKYRFGGLLDLDFAAQYLQLRYASRNPDILLRDAASVFRKAGEDGLISKSQATILTDSTLFWRNLQGILMLTTEGDQLSEDTSLALRKMVGRTCGQEILNRFEETMDETAEAAYAACREVLQPGTIFQPAG